MFVRSGCGVSTQPANDTRLLRARMRLVPSHCASAATAAPGESGGPGSDRSATSSMRRARPVRSSTIDSVSLRPTSSTMKWSPPRRPRETSTTSADSPPCANFCSPASARVVASCWTMDGIRRAGSGPSARSTSDNRAPPCTTVATKPTPSARPKSTTSTTPAPNAAPERARRRKPSTVSAVRGTRRRRTSSPESRTRARTASQKSSDCAASSGSNRAVHGRSGIRSLSHGLRESACRRRW